MDSISSESGICSYIYPSLHSYVMFIPMSAGLHYFHSFFLKRGRRKGTFNIVSLLMESLLKNSECNCLVSIVKNDEFPSQIECLLLNLLLDCTKLIWINISRKYISSDKQHRVQAKCLYSPQNNFSFCRLHISMVLESCRKKNSNNITVSCV